MFGFCPVFDVDEWTHALVCSCLDYWNAVLSGIAHIDFTKLQHAQNWLAHVVTKSPPFTPSAPLLHSLHWMPVKFGTDFKICLLTCTILHEKQPVYLQSMLATSLASRSLRSHQGIPLISSHCGLAPQPRGTASCYQCAQLPLFQLPGNI